MWCNIIHWGLETGSVVVPEEGTDPVPETQRIKYQYDGRSPYSQRVQMYIAICCPRIMNLSVYLTRNATHS